MRFIPLLGLACAAGLALMPHSASAQGAQQFDGRWSILVMTENGNCDKAYRYSVQIENGQARYAGTEGFDVQGSVRPNGQVSGSISYGQDRADVNGRLAGNWGTGTWTASSTSRNCGGRWEAEKRE